MPSDDERARLWPLTFVDHQDDAGHQRRTERETPLALLKPVG